MISAFVVPGLPEVTAGDDVAALIATAAGADLDDGDIVAITSKIVSKAEGRIRPGADRERAISEQTVRVVTEFTGPHGTTRIVENPQGLVMAAAGVDSSNAPPGYVLLLPEDPDASARSICAALRESTGKRIGVLLTDTLGRPWREGQTDAAIGAAGVRVIDDLRGTTDSSGKILEATLPAVADEIAAPADLVKGKAGGTPVAIVRGLAHLVGDLDLPGARSLQRSARYDRFRLGSEEAWREGYAAGLHAARDPAGS